LLALPIGSAGSRGFPVTLLAKVSDAAVQVNPITGQLPLLWDDEGIRAMQRGLNVDTSKEELERETGIEPATNGLGSRDSTTELLPLLKIP
jgi:hypothetical protein